MVHVVAPDLNLVDASEKVKRTHTCYDDVVVPATTTTTTTPAAAHTNTSATDAFRGFQFDADPACDNRSLGSGFGQVGSVLCCI